jgi:hypothetical protein
VKQHETLQAFAYAAAFSVATGLSMIGGLAFLRSGLPTPASLAPLCALLLVAAAVAPFLLPVRLLAPDDALPGIAPAASLATLMLPLLAFAGAPLVWATVSLVAVAGLWRAARWLRGLSWSAWLFLAVAAPLTAFHVYPADAATWVWAPETARYGLLDNASYFQTAIAYLVQSYGVPSIGADGLHALHYHFGSHYWFAGIGLAAGSTPLYTYPFARLGVLIPALYFGVSYAAVALARDRGSSSAVFMTVVGVLAIFDALIFALHYNSESFTFSIVGALLILPLLVRLYLGERGTPAAGSSTAWICAVAAIAAITALKVSTGYVLLAMLLYSALRQFGRSWKTGATVAAVAAILLAAAAFLSPRGYTISGWQLLLASYQQYIVPQTLFTLVIPLACALFAWFEPRLAPDGAAGRLEFRARTPRIAALPRYLFTGDRTLTQLMVVAAAAALLPVLVLPIGSNASYFSLMPHWLLMPVVVGFLAAWIAHAWTPLGTGALAAALSAITTFTFLPLTLDMAGVLRLFAAVDRGAPGSPVLGEPPSLRRFFATNLKAEGTLFDAAFRDKLAAYGWSRRLDEIRAAARTEGRQFGVFVPASNRAFWTKLEGTGPYWCADMHLYIPSQTGALMVRGLQPADLPCVMFAPGSPDYGPESRTGEATDAALCAHGARVGVRRILVLASMDDAAANRTLSCDPAK